MKKWMAMLLALAIFASLGAFAQAEAGAAPVCAVEDLRGNFNPLFAAFEGDRTVAALTNGALLTTARGGDVATGGIEGETIAFDCTDYTYTGLGDVQISRNADGSADYALTLREGVCFSDGEPLDIDDVIFTMYVLADADYDGPSGFARLPIEGLDAYRGSLQRLDELLLDAGRENADFSAWDEETQAAFWADIDAAGAQLCQEIVDYCLETHLDQYAQVIGSTKEAILADPALQVKFAMFMWGYADTYVDGATTADFWAALLDAYEGDVRAAESTEKVATPLKDFIEGYEAKYGAQVSTGSGAASISGIVRTGDFSLNLHMTEYTPDALYELALYIAPLHHYGDAALYDYANNSFGFTRGDLSAVRAQQPAVGCGPYVVESVDAGGVTLRANENYYKGKPAVETLRIADFGRNGGLNAVLDGEADLAVAQLSASNVAAISAANGDAGLSGARLDALLVDAPAYEYLGVNAALVKVGDDAASDASKALRKALLTVLAAKRDEMVAQNLGDSAFVIEYPVISSSWAAPTPEDEGYEVCYARDVSGEAIYIDSVSDEQRHAAALEAAVGYLKAAGYSWDEAQQRFTAAPEGAAMEYLCSIEEDSPAQSLVEVAAAQLGQIGIRLNLRSLSADELDAALESNGAQLWITGRSFAHEPDLYGMYHSDNAGGEDVDGNIFRIADAQLDACIAGYLSETDRAARRSSCKAALDAVMDWGCVLPLYQEYRAVVVAADRIDADSLPEDLTPDYGWWAEIEQLELR